MIDQEASNSKMESEHIIAHSHQKRPPLSSTESAQAGSTIGSSRCRSSRALRGRSGGAWVPARLSWVIAVVALIAAAGGPNAGMVSRGGPDRAAAVGRL